MVMLCRCASRSVALRAEARFKKLKRRDKELIIFFHGTGARFHCTRM
jgi:predicted GIY-YIG superfamily endonuclease